MMSAQVIKKVVQYYDGTTFEYNVFAGMWWHHSIHYGYYDETHKTPWVGTLNANRELARKANIQKGTNVLDAGCGIGGSSIWLAKNIGAIVTGITLSEKQKRHADTLAQKYRAADKTTFLVRDFCDTKFPDKSFDVVWAIESVCHAEDKKDFLKEAYRVLKPGGRLIVADGFKKKDTMTVDEYQIYSQWLRGWAVENLATIEGFVQDMKTVGFRNIVIENATSHVLPFSQWLYLLALVVLPVAKFLHLFGIFSQMQINNGMSAKLQYPGLKQGLWVYMIYQAEKSR